MSKMQKIRLTTLLFVLFAINASAQYKSFKLTTTGDTINIVDKKGLKQGNWVNTVAALRGEPGYEEEGVYKNDQKTGTWRLYNTTGDIIGVENYLFGGKDGVQQYYSYLGALIREESWKGYNPDAPYDTIPVYGNGNGEITSFKIVKAEQYSVKDGDWKFYNTETGEVESVEHFDRGRLVKDKGDNSTVTDPTDKPKTAPKPQAILDYEKKNKNKKQRDGNTGTGY
jgi:antitoxin component YwqK of YwqJK toxin-antitoxin module